MAEHSASSTPLQLCKACVRRASVCALRTPPPSKTKAGSSVAQRYVNTDAALAFSWWSAPAGPELRARGSLVARPPTRPVWAFKLTRRRISTATKSLASTPAQSHCFWRDSPRSPARSVRKSRSSKNDRQVGSKRASRAALPAPRPVLANTSGGSCTPDLGCSRHRAQAPLPGQLPMGLMPRNLQQNRTRPGIFNVRSLRSRQQPLEQNCDLWSAESSLSFRPSMIMASTCTRSF